LDIEKIKADYRTEQIKELKEEIVEENKIENLIKKIPSGRYIRKYRKKPLLIFYILDLYKGSVKKGEVTEKNVIAYAISFPETKDIICSNDRVAKYKVNKVFLKELFEKEKDNYEY
jgi:hypothetical protein